MGCASVGAESFSRMRKQDAERESAESILPRVRHHAGAQTSTKERECAEHRAVQGDDHHLLRALIEMSHAEDDGGESDAGGGVACKRRELALKISAKDELFAKAGGDGKQDPENDLARSVRDERREILGRL